MSPGDAQPSFLQTIRKREIILESVLKRLSFPPQKHHQLFYTLVFPITELATASTIYM